MRAGEDITAGDLVQVTGPVRQFDIAALEEDPGVDLTDDAFTELEDRPVIVASGVNPVHDGAPARRAARADADELTDSPQEHLTQQLTVRDFTVDEPGGIPRAPWRST